MPCMTGIETACEILKRVSESSDRPVDLVPDLRACGEGSRNWNSGNAIKDRHTSSYRRHRCPTTRRRIHRSNQVKLDIRSEGVASACLGCPGVLL